MRERNVYFIIRDLTQPDRSPWICAMPISETKCEGGELFLDNHFIEVLFETRNKIVAAGELKALASGL